MKKSNKNEKPKGFARARNPAAKNSAIKAAGIVTKKSQNKSTRQNKKVGRAGKNSVKGPVITRVINKKKIFILGTAHISRQSVEDVEILLAGEKPDVVCVELCSSRYKAMTDPSKWRKLDIVQVIKERKLFLLMSSLLLAVFQKKLGEGTMVKPGEEIRTAVKIALAKKIPLELIDRDIQLTLKRAWQSLGYFSKFSLISEMITGLFFSPKLDPGEIERMKEKDILEDLFQNLPSRYDYIKNIIIDERDRFLAQKIQDTIEKFPQAKKIAVIVGAGHLQGIKKYLAEKHDLSALQFIKPESKFLAMLKFFAPIVIIMSLFYYFSNTGEPGKIWENIKAWVIIKSFCSGFLTLILLAHPLAILGAIVTAPISNFNPVLKPGWVAALIEAKFHKPQVSDFENLSVDTQSLKGFFKNKVIRIFSVFILPQLGSSLGTGLALWYIA